MSANRAARAMRIMSGSLSDGRPTSGRPPCSAVTRKTNVSLRYLLPVAQREARRHREQECEHTQDDADQSEHPRVAELVVDVLVRRVVTEVGLGDVALALLVALRRGHRVV